MTLKREDYGVRVPRSQRGGEIVEPLVREQWFVRMQPLAQPALQVTSPHTCSERLHLAKFRGCLFKVQVVSLRSKAETEQSAQMYLRDTPKFHKTCLGRSQLRPMCFAAC